MSADVVGSRAGVQRARLGDAILVSEISQFLAYESELLDDRKFHEWMEIVADDFTYEVPTPRTPDCWRKSLRPRTPGTRGPKRWSPCWPRTTR